MYYSADHKLLDGNPLDGQAEVFGSDDDHIQFVQVHIAQSEVTSGSKLTGKFDSILKFSFNKGKWTTFIVITGQRPAFLGEKTIIF